MRTGSFHRRFLTAVMFFLCLLVFAATAIAAEQWHPAGLQGKTVTAVVPSPILSGDKTVFAGTAGAGIFRSADGGTTWTQVNAGLQDLQVTSLAVSPDFASDKTVFAGTTATTDGSGGAYKSVDGGETWSRVVTGMAGAKLNISCLAISPRFATDRTVFAGIGEAGSVVYKSTDGGANWTAAYFGHAFTALGISPSYSSDGTLLIGVLDAGLWIFNLNGANFTGLPLNGNITTALALSPAYAQDGTAFAATDTGILKLTGNRWEPKNTGIGNIAMTALALSANFTKDRTVFAASAPGATGIDCGIFRSADGGTTWQRETATATNFSVKALAVTPDNTTLFAGTADGVLSRRFAPAPGGVKIDNGALLTKSIKVTLSLIPENPQETAQMCISNNETCTKWISFTGSKSWTLAKGDGTKAVRVWYKDRQGNSSLVPATASIVLDTKAPLLTVSVTSPTTVATQEITGTVEEGATITVTRKGYNGTGPTVTGTTWTYTALELKKGSNIFIVTATDAAGNIAKKSVTIALKPQKSGVTPPTWIQGKWEGGEPLKLQLQFTGNNVLNSSKQPEFSGFVETEETAATYSLTKPGTEEKSVFTKVSATEMEWWTTNGVLSNTTAMYRK